MQYTFFIGQVALRDSSLFFCVSGERPLPEPWREFGWENLRLPWTWQDRPCHCPKVDMTWPFGFGIVDGSLQHFAMGLVNCPTQSTCFAHFDPLCFITNLKWEIWKKHSRALSYYRVFLLVYIAKMKNDLLPTRAVFFKKISSVKKLLLNWASFFFNQVWQWGGTIKKTPCRHEFWIHSSAARLLPFGISRLIYTNRNPTAQALQVLLLK